jgi:hypothetical protein
MKLSSTMNTASRQPRARNCSSSAMTWETALVRGALAVYLDNVAELAIVWAAARVLDCHRGIAAHFDQAEVGQTAGLHGRPFGGLVGGRRGPTFEVARQAADQGLGFADHHVVCLEFFHREAAGNGPPITVRRPRARQRSTMAASELR